YYFLDLKNPKTFNEKLNYLKSLPLKDAHTLLADKYLVREYIRESIGEKYLVPLLGVYDTPNDILLEKLPQSFILKTNHGSGWNYICKNKATYDKKKVDRLFQKWLSYNAYYLSREKQYKNIPPLIICEQLLEFDIYDYKFFCFNGEPDFVQVDIDRFTNHTRAFYNLSWGKLPFSIRYKISQKDIRRPAQLDEMISIARTLSKNLSFSRIDLYIHKNQVYFGEITLIPGGGNEPFVPVEYDLEVGKLLELN
ncbi:MAG: ATP-grasp fold amidoligase family protein, partial [Ginsengibacter sp.]